MNIKILIVEDEPLMRKMYASYINEIKDDFLLVGSVKNGADALDFLRRNDVDIVITDLKMPIMSGIELIRICKTEFPKIKFVVISGYNDFSLVRDAFSFGAKKYLLKYEIDSKSLLEVLLSIKKEILDENQSQIQNNTGVNSAFNLGIEKNIVEISHNALHEKLFKELIWSPHTDTATLRKKLNESGIYIKEQNIYVMVLSFAGYFDYEKNQWDEDRELLKYAILNVLEEVCKRSEGVYVFYNLPDEYVFLLSNEKENSKDYFTKFYGEVKSAINQCFTLNCIAGISDKTDSLLNLKKLYRAARLAADCSYLFGNHNPVFYNNILNTGKEIQNTELISELKTALNSFSSDAITRIIAKLKISPEMVGHEQIPAIKTLFHLYYNEIKIFLKSENLIEEISHPLSMYTEAEKSNTLHAMNKWLDMTLHIIADVFTGKYLVIKVKNYVKQHYKEQIVLKDIAEMLQVSESHLSRVFKKEQKENFTQYLLRTRMNVAIELMKKTNMKIYEIATEVGYSNSQQFSKMFKKVTGKTPTTFLQ